jgi:hypothetical protein
VATPDRQLFDEHPGNFYVNRILVRQFAIGEKFMEGEKSRLLGVPTIALKSRPIQIFQKIKDIL